MKRLFLLTYLNLLCFSGLELVGMEEMKAGEWIVTKDSTEHKGVKSVNDKSFFGECHDGDWVSFGPYHLKDGLVDRVELQLATPKTEGKIEIRLDSPTGSKVAEVVIRETGSFGKYVPQQGHSEQLGGRHKLYFVFKDGKHLCNFKAFRFLKPGQKGALGSFGPDEGIDKSVGLPIEQVISGHKKAIEKHRTRVVKVLSSPGAKVKIEQTRHHFEFGTAINKSAFVEKSPMSSEDKKRYKEIVLNNFNSVVHENAMKWYSNERKMDVQDFAAADAMLKWSNENGLFTRGHCVYWGRDKLVPQWQKDIDDEALRKKLIERAKIYMTRFSGITEHDMNNEMVHCNYYKKRLGKDIWKQMFEWCHQFDPNASLYVNDYSILSGGDTPKYIKQIEGFLKQGIKVGGIGVQGHFGGQKLSSQKLKAKLDQLGKFNLPIKITEFDVNSKDEKRKAESLATVYATAFAHPAVEGIYMWGFWEKRHWRPNAALWKADWSETPSAKLYRDLVFERWWTNEQFTADSQGESEVRVFYGDHLVTINGKSHRVNVTPDQLGQTLDCRSSNPSEWVIK